MKRSYLTLTALAVASMWSLATPGEDDIPPRWMHAAQGGQLASAGSWQKTVVDAIGDVGLYTSLAVPATGPYAGRPAMSYYDATNGDLKFAWKDAQGWHSTTVDGTGNVGLFTSLAFQPLSEDPYISYVDATHAELRIATHDAWNWDDGNWGWWPCIVDVDCSYPGYTTSLKFQAWDPLVAVRGCQDNVGCGLLCLDASVCDVMLVDGERFAGMCSSMAIDPDNDQPAIAYTGDWGRLTYAWRDAQELWHSGIYPIAPGIRGGWHCSLAFFPSDHPVSELRGEPAIAYYDTDIGSLNFAWHDASAGWGRCEVARSYQRGTVLGKYPSLAIRPNGHPAISFAKERWGEPDELRYAQHAGDFDFCEGWACETVDAQGQPGWYSSLAILPNGEPAISYYDKADGDLKYAVRRIYSEEEVRHTNQDPEGEALVGL
jgi:hypothetical protein